MKRHDVLYWICIVMVLINTWGAVFWYGRNAELFKLFLLSLLCSLVGLFTNYIAGNLDKYEK